MADRRRANVEWHIANEAGELYSSMQDGATLATLMDIRDELQKLNALLSCSNFVGIPHTLRAIARKIPARRPKPRSKQ